MLRVIKELKNKLASIQGISGVFVHVPQQTPYPYITLELTEVVAGIDSLKGYRRRTGKILLKIWSQYRGIFEVFDIALRVEKQVEGATLVFSEGKASIKTSPLVINLERDGLTRVATLKLEAFVCD